MFKNAYFAQNCLEKAFSHLPLPLFIYLTFSMRSALVIFFLRSGGDADSSCLLGHPSSQMGANKCSSKKAGSWAREAVQYVLFRVSFVLLAGVNCHCFTSEILMLHITACIAQRSVLCNQARRHLCSCVLQHIAFNAIDWHSSLTSHIPTSCSVLTIHSPTSIHVAEPAYWCSLMSRSPASLQTALVFSHTHPP